MAHHKQGKKNRKWGRSARKPSNIGKIGRARANKIRRLEKALARNPNCRHTRQALAQARKA